MAFNDRCAVGLLDTAIRAGVDVPADMSVIGYDDDRLSRLSHINLTTIAQDARQLASLAVDQAVARTNGDRPVERELVIPPRLIVRGTTGPPPRVRPALQ